MLLPVQSAFATGSLTVTVSSHIGVVGVPLSVTVEGFANGSDELYVFAAVAAAEECAVDPNVETNHPGEISTLSDSGVREYSNAAEGEAVDAGEFKHSYTFAPWGGYRDFVICAYLDVAPEAAPDAHAQTSIAIPEPGPVKAPYLNEAVKEFSPVAIAEGQRKEREREQLEKERAEREHPPLPPSETTSDEPPPAVNDSTKRCLVPALHGRTLVDARAALKRADCRLGAVKRPIRARGRLVVVRQSVRSGSRRAADAAVAVVLGRRSR